MGGLKFGQTHEEALAALDRRGETQPNGTITSRARIEGDDYDVTAEFDGDRLRVRLESVVQRASLRRRRMAEAA